MNASRRRAQGWPAKVRVANGSLRTAVELDTRRRHTRPSMTSTIVRIVLAAVLTCGLTARARAEEPARPSDPGVTRRMTPEEVQQHRKAGDKLIVLDARAQVTDAIIPGAVHVPNEEIDAWAKGKPKDALIVAYCT
jgi:hypothetical protein